MTEPTLIWKDPTSNSQHGRWDGVAAELRQHPGQWAFLGRTTTRFAYDVRHGRNTSFRPAGAFEATARDIDRSQGDIYVRYVGEGE